MSLLDNGMHYLDDEHERERAYIVIEKWRHDDGTLDGVLVFGPDEEQTLRKYMSIYWGEKYTKEWGGLWIDIFSLGKLAAELKGMGTSVIRPRPYRFNADKVRAMLDPSPVSKEEIKD